MNHCEGMKGEDAVHQNEMENITGGHIACRNVLYRCVCLSGSGTQQVTAACSFGKRLGV
jgi:hypothetical protein